MRFATTLIVIGFPTSHLAAQRADTVVRRATAPVHAGVASLQREISIGIADGDEHYILGAINDIAVGANGAIYVWDRSVPAIRMYDAAGKYVRTIGAKGRGPGEYQSGSAIAIGRNGNLLQWDPGNARINNYSMSGDVLDSWPTRGGSGTAIGRRLMTVDTAGNAYVQVTIFNRSAPEPRPRRGWLHFGSDGSLRDTLFPPAAPPELKLEAMPSPGSIVSAPVPFAPVQYTAISPHGYFVTALSNRIAIDLHENDRPLASIRRETQLQPVSAAERDSARSHVIENMRKSLPTWSWNGPEIPRVKPAHRGVEVGLDGTLWVRMAEGPRRNDGTPPPTVSMGGGTGGGPGRGMGATWSCPANGWLLFDLYEPSGRYLGQVRVPERVDPLIMRGDQVWAATCSEDDVPMVVRYRIAWR